MPFTVTMPKLSPTMEEGAIAKWHKKEGDFVEPGELLLEISTDKATVEHNALDGGWLRKILIPEGKTGKINQPIAIFTEDKKENIENYKPQGVTPTEAPKETEKPAAPQERQPKEAPTSIPQAKFSPEEPLKDYAFEFPVEEASTRLRASPLARKLAKERGIDITTIKGTGPGERIVSKDLEMGQPAGLVNFGRRERPNIPPGTYEEEELTPMRKVIGQRMQESKTFIPHIYVSVTVNARPLVELREQLSQNNLKVTVNDLIVRACALALRKHPNVNSGYNSVNHRIIRFKTVDVAVAVTIPQGLVTPIIRHADYKNVGEISVEIRSLAKRAKEGKLEPHEYKGGSFTVSNLGMYGVTNFQAIINPPQAAILAVSGIQEVPIVNNGAVVPGKTMNLTLSADHHVLDGVSAAEFLKTVQGLLESPVALIL